MNAGDVSGAAEDWVQQNGLALRTADLCHAPVMQSLAFKVDPLIRPMQLLDCRNRLGPDVGDM